MSSNFNLPPETVISWLPADRNNDLMADMDFYIVMATELGFSNVEGVDQVTKNNGVLRDQITLTPLPPKDVIADYFKQRNWLKTIPGEGSGATTLSGFRADWIKSNPNADPNGPEFQDAIQKHTKGKENFQWYK